MQFQFLLTLFYVISTSNNTFELGGEIQCFFFLASTEKMAFDYPWIIALVHN